MRHGKNLLKLSRKTKPRYRLLRNLVTSLLEHERIRTTWAKAKAMRGMADKMISLGKRQTPTPARRRVLIGSYVYTAAAVEKVVSELVPRYKDVHGNYAWIRDDGHRKGDGARMAIIQYKGNPYQEYEEQLALEKEPEKVPNFTLKLLREECSFFEAALAENHEDLTKASFFTRQLDRVKREIDLLEPKQ